MKTELTNGQVYATRAAAKSTIFYYVEIFYNRVRHHGALGFYSPMNFENSLS